MKKSEIVALGIAEELAEKVLELAKADIDGNYVPKSRFDEVNEAKKNAEALVKERDGQLEELKKSASDSAELQKQIEDLQTANKEAKKEYEGKITQMRIDSAVEKAIADANGKNVKAIKALLNLDGAKLAEDGSVEGLADQIKSLTEADDSSFLFGTSSPKGFTPTESGTGAKDADGGNDFSKMSYSELSAYLATHPDAKLT